MHSPHKLYALQTVPLTQVPQVSEFPHLSEMIPQVLPSSSHVVGLHTERYIYKECVGIGAKDLVKRKMSELMYALAIVL